MIEESLPLPRRNGSPPKNFALSRLVGFWELLLAPLGFARRGGWLGYWVALGLDFWVLQLSFKGEFGSAISIFLAGRLGTVWAFNRQARKGPAPSKDSLLGIRIAQSSYVASLILQWLDLHVPAVHSLFGEFPASAHAYENVANGIDTSIGWLSNHFSAAFNGLTQGMNISLNILEAVLGAIPWPVALLLLTFVAWRKGGVALAALIALALLYVGLFGFWAKTVTTAALVIFAFAICIVIGIPVGIAAAKNRVLKAIILPCLDVMQTMPSFVYLLPAVAFFSIGKPPALVATVIFAVPPLIRLTCLGLDQIPTVVKEAMYSHGATPLQTLFKAELPLAAPSIRAGINQSIMMSLSMVVIAALIGGGGLGYDVLFALQNVQYGRGILAGLAIVFCAIVFDRLMRIQQTASRNQVSKP